MQTVVLSIDPLAPQSEMIERATAVIRGGGLVAFPTETVYGLGADALSDAAVRRIFAAKGRPANNPVIVHVLDVAAARELTTVWPAAAQQAAERWWPGPLTLVLPKTAVVPDVTTAGGPTVAIRVPAHPVARALIAAAQRPLAAPSANLSTRISATRAEHVRGLNGKVEMILDGGPTHAGLESTVVDLSGRVPRLLRPGPISSTELFNVFGSELEGVDIHADESAAALPSPGLLRKHYAPLVPLELTADDGFAIVQSAVEQGRRIGWIPLATPRDNLPPNVLCRPLGHEPIAYAQRLYDTLHELEQTGVERIIVELPPDTPEWAAIRDRLHRAAAV